MIIDLEEFKKHQEYRRQINQTPLEELVIMDADQKVEIEKWQIDEWKFTGLSNWDFIKTEFWKEIEPFIPQEWIDQDKIIL